jgi:two-component system sensor histidine kinase VicK
MINMLPAAVVVIRGPELVVEMVNESNLDYWNKTRDEVIGKPLLEILPELAGQAFPGQLRQVMETGKIVDIKESPVLFENADGSIRETFVDYTYQALTDASGKRTGVLVMSFEITERVTARRLLEKYADELEETNMQLAAANNELAGSEARFKYLIQEAPVAIGVLSGRGLLIDSANDMILRIWGKTRAVVGLPLALALPELDGQPFLGILDEVFTSGKAFYGNELRAMLGEAGELREYFLNFVYQPIQNETGATAGILVVATDVTEQVNSRKTVEEAEERLRMATESGGLAAWQLNEKLGKIIATPRFNELFGFAPDEEVPYTAAITQILPEYREMVQDAVAASFTSGAHFNVEYPLSGFHNGKLRWVRSVGKFVRDEVRGNYITGVTADITEQKMDEIRKNDFIGMVSHELKTPLTSLSALLQVASLKLKNSEDNFLADAVAKSNGQVKRMTAMINGFLNISRLESGKIYIEKQSFDLNALIGDMIAEARLTVSSHEFRLAPGAPLTIKADRYKIGSVISNLLSNAVKYSPKGQRVDVACLQQHGQAVVSVKDDGMGIKAGDLDKIFDRYYRVETSHTRHISGFGIGLYLSAEIIRRHDGRIWAEERKWPGQYLLF